jgi:serine/threonine-protein phosphatase 2A activator
MLSIYHKLDIEHTMTINPTAESSTPLLTTYTVPSKRILSAAHLAAFQRSATYRELLDFIDVLNASIVGRTLIDAGEGSEVC